MVFPIEYKNRSKSNRLIEVTFLDIRRLKTF